MQPGEYEKMFEAEDRYFWFVGKRRLLVDLLSDLLKGVSNPLIVDIGCGTGGLMQEISRLGTAVGIDHDGGALAFCKRRGAERLVRMQWQRPALRPGTCDAVVASDFIEHLDDDARALAEMRDLLKEGGRLLLTVPAMPWLWGPHDVALGHKRRYTRSALMNALETAGLRPMRVFNFMGTLLPFLVPLRVALKIAGNAGDSRPETISYDMNPALNRFFLKLLDLERKSVMAGHNMRIGSTLVVVAGKAA